MIGKFRSAQANLNKFKTSMPTENEFHLPLYQKYLQTWAFQKNFKAVSTNFLNQMVNKIRIGACGKHLLSLTALFYFCKNSRSKGSKNCIFRQMPDRFLLQKTVAGKQKQIIHNYFYCHQRKKILVFARFNWKSFYQASYCK